MGRLTPTGVCDGRLAACCHLEEHAQPGVVKGFVSVRVLDDRKASPSCVSTIYLLCSRFDQQHIVCTC